jgi:hypothetical protein
MGEIGVLSSALVIDLVELAMGESEETRKSNS